MNLKKSVLRAGLKRLEAQMTSHYTAVHPQRSPVLGIRHDRGTLKRIIRQYSFLSKHAVPFLSDSNLVLRANGWHSLADMNEKTIAEESGAPGPSHYEIFCQSAEKELGIALRRTRPGSASRRFVSKWLAIARHDRPEFVAGALYAFELTGVPEMTLAKRLIEKYAKAAGIKFDKKGRLAGFFDSHTGVFEVEHARRIRQSIGEHLKTRFQLGLFSQGFHEVMRTMEEWWQGMADEARVKR